MSARHVTNVRAFAFVEKTPPDAIKLWNAGANPTDYGVHNWTPTSTKLIGDRYAARGNLLQIDIEHNLSDKVQSQVSPIDTPPVTGGYADLEIRDGEPWLVFQWSAYAVEQIATGQRLFLSPDYDVDPESGEIVNLNRVSLVGNPGTHFARMLAFASGTNKTGNGKMDLKLILAALAAALGAKDPAVAKQSIVDLVAQLQPLVDADAGDPPPVDDPIVDDTAAGAVADPNKAPVMAAAPRIRVADALATPAPAPKPVKVDTSEITNVTAAAIRTIDDKRRDLLLQTDGDRLPAPMLAWAKTQPLTVVEGVLASMPAKIAPTERVTATRGRAPTDENPLGEGLQGEEKAELDRAMGLVSVTAGGPKVSTDGTLRIEAISPSAWRAKKAALAAGKNG